MPDVYLYDQDDGTVAIVTPAPDHGLTEAEFLERTVPPGKTVSKMPAQDLSVFDRYFRGAWRRVDGSIKVDLPHARQIHMGHIRKARDKRLAQLDLDYMRADEQGKAADKAQIASRKQELRDLPTTFDLSGALTPEALKLLWPPDLPRE